MYEEIVLDGIKDIPLTGNAAYIWIHTLNLELHNHSHRINHDNHIIIASSTSQQATLVLEQIIVISYCSIENTNMYTHGMCYCIIMGLACACMYCTCVTCHTGTWIAIQIYLLQNWGKNYSLHEENRSFITETCHSSIN